MSYPGASCLICGQEFAGTGAFCSGTCRGESFRRHEEHMVNYFRQPGSIWPGDAVRLKTDAEKALEAMADGFH